MKIPPYIGYPILAVFAWLAAWFIANRQVFHPMRYPAGWWEGQAQLGVEDVSIRTPDGLTLHGWWKESPGSDLVTLYLHGNAGNVTHRGRHIQEIVAAGSSVLVIDYRGYGKSQGRPSEQGLYTDAEAAYDYLLTQGYGPHQIVLHGESLGTSVAMDLAIRRPARGVILEAPFTSAGDVAHRILPFLGPLLVRSFPTKSKIGNLKWPLLLIHGTEDEIIPFEMGRELFDLAPEPKQFREVPGAGHNDITEIGGPEYRRWLLDFYSAPPGEA